MKGGIRAPRTAGGTWAYRIDLGPGPGGRRNQKQVAGFSSGEGAEAALAEALAAQGGGDSRTVAGFLERVWLPAKASEVERSTWDQYAWAVRRHIIPSLGAMKLADLTPALLEDWLVNLMSVDRTGRRPLGATSARLVRKVLSMACVEAVERGFLAENPVRRTEAPPAADSGRLGWTVDEARRFLTAAAGHRLRLAFQLALLTGLRCGELLSLRWSDIDFDKGQLVVHQQLVLEGGHARIKPLNLKDRRVLTLAPTLMELLAEHRHQ
jgi:integrase